MKNILKSFSILLLALLVGLSTAYGHGKNKEPGHDDMEEMDHSNHVGKSIRDSEVGKFQLAYHLVDNKEQMKKMEGKKGMKMEGHDMSKMKSHHLMLYLADQTGKNIEDAKVGYMVTAPGGDEQKTMAMFMKGGYGADVDIKSKGEYKIKIKAVFGDEKVIDTFTHEVK